MEVINEIPYKYDEKKTINLKAYRAEKKIKDLFTKHYKERVKWGLKHTKLKKDTRIYEYYIYDLEEYYGKVLSEIEKVSNKQIEKTLDKDLTIVKILKMIQIPEINYLTGK